MFVPIRVNDDFWGSIVLHIVAVVLVIFLRASPKSSGSASARLEPREKLSCAHVKVVKSHQYGDAWREGKIIYSNYGWAPNYTRSVSGKRENNHATSLILKSYSRSNVFAYRSIHACYCMYTYTNGSNIIEHAGFLCACMDRTDIPTCIIIFSCMQYYGNRGIRGCVCIWSCRNPINGNFRIIRVASITSTV